MKKSDAFETLFGLCSWFDDIGRPQTAQKLRQKLSDRGVSVGVIDSTISDLQRW